jgi:hypothetical protein
VDSTLSRLSESLHSFQMEIGGRPPHPTSLFLMFSYQHINPDHFLFFLSQYPLLEYNIHINTHPQYNSLIREGFLLGKKTLKQLLPSYLLPYSERSRLTTKLRYFTRSFFPKFCFRGAVPESPAWGGGGYKNCRPPPFGPPRRQLWGGKSPPHPPLGNGVQARLKQTSE